MVERGRNGKRERTKFEINDSGKKFPVFIVARL